MCKLYVYQTRLGPFFIAYSRGHFRVLFENEILASHSSAEEAARHLGTRGKCKVTGIDTAVLGIPPSIARWESCLQMAVNA